MDRTTTAAATTTVTSSTTSTTENRIHIKVLFFAKSRELAGCHEAQLELESGHITCGHLLNILCDRFNLTLIKHTIIVAVREEYRSDLNELLQLRDGEEVAIIPPISGG